MVYNFRLLFRLIYLSLFKTKGTHLRLTAKRIKFLIFFFILIIYGTVLAWYSFLLDNIFFRKYRQQKIKQPVFIIGNFRSGTTFLHRLFAKDEKRFTCLKTWEIYLAPSISQRKLIKGLYILDKLLGSPIGRKIDKIEKNMFQPFKLHRVGLKEPEEDEGLLFYIFSSLFIWFLFPVQDEVKIFHYFDREMPVWRKKGIMKFYRSCVQRHLFAHGVNKQFLSKNTSFAPKIDSLLKYFPGAKIIYVIRNPLEMFPSEMSWFSFCWQCFCNLLEEFPFKKEVIEMSKHWYTYPVNRLKQEPKENYILLNYDNIIKNPEKTVKKVYKRFGFNMSRRFEEIIKHETEKAKSFKRSKISALNKIGLTKKQIINEFREIYDHFQFDINVESR